MATETPQNLNKTTAAPTGSGAVLLILLTASFSHLLNDTIQSLIPAIYPVLKDSFQLSFAQIGLITLTFQVTASLLQPLVGLYTDHRPQHRDLIRSVSHLRLSAAQSAQSVGPPLPVVA
jgi:MFS transporter, FSR family, fosmidomycin resistance protein